MTTLTDFLLARIAEDEDAARETAAALPEPWEVADRGWMARLYRDGSSEPILAIEQDQTVNGDPGAVLRHLERLSPTRVLTECEAKREIIPRHERCGDGMGPCDEYGSGPCDLARLAQVYADHQDFDPAWAPV